MYGKSLAHVRAMVYPKADGQRYILHNKGMWAKEIADITAKEFNPRGFQVPTNVIPKPILFFAQIFDKTVRYLYPRIGKIPNADNKKSVEQLQIQYRDVNMTFKDLGESLIKFDLVKAKKGAACEKCKTGSVKTSGGCEKCNKTEKAAKK